MATAPTTLRDPPNATLAGALDAEELLNAIARLGADDDALDEEAIQFLIRSVDANGDGEVGEGGPKDAGTRPTTAAVATQSPPPRALEITGTQRHHPYRSSARSSPR